MANKLGYKIDWVSLYWCGGNKKSPDHSLTVTPVSLIVACCMAMAFWDNYFNMLLFGGYFWLSSVNQKISSSYPFSFRWTIKFSVILLKHHLLYVYTCTKLKYRLNVCDIVSDNIYMPLIKDVFLIGLDSCEKALIKHLLILPTLNCWWSCWILAEIISATNMTDERVKMAWSSLLALFNRGWIWPWTWNRLEDKVITESSPQRCRSHRCSLRF